MKQRLKLFCGAVLGAGLLMITAPPAPAGEPAPKAESADTIVVTANKMKEDADKVPMAMTLFSGDDLEQRGIHKVDDLLDRIPNLFSTGVMTGNLRMMSFRGKTTMGFTEANPLIIYVDGVPMDSYFNADPSLLDVERVEILHGPQSTLYGKGSMGGVMNIITKTPDNTVRVKAGTGFGSHETAAVRGEVSGPLMRDRVFLGLSAQYDRTDGYMDHPTADRGNDASRKRAKARLRVLPENGLEIDLHSEIFKEDRGYDAVIKGPEPTLDSELNPEDYTDASGINSALKLACDFGPFRGESISTHRFGEVDYAQDFTFLGIGVGRTGRRVEDREFTQEFRLTSAGDDSSALSWIAGAYASDGMRDRKDIKSEIPGFSMETHLPNREDTNDYAVYGQLTLPFLERFSLTGALRYQYTEKDIAFRYYNIVGGTRVPVLNTSASDHWNALLPKLALGCRVTGDTMVWASLSKGFQPGGFNWSSGSRTPDDYTFKPQESRDWEVGVKTALLNRTLILTASLFYSAIDDMQLISYNPATFAYTASNAAEATIWGAETQADLRLNRNWAIGATCALSRAELDEYAGTGASGAFDYSGNKVPYTPDITLGGHIQYSHEAGWTARADVRHFGRLYWDEANSISRGSTTVVDARIGYETEYWSIFLVGSNLFDERYLDYLQPATSYAMVAPPLTVGIQIDLRL